MMELTTGRRAIRRGITVGLLTTGLSACGVIEPKLLNDADIQSRIDADRGSISAASEKVAGPISLYEAMARALKYNLDYRVEIMERALAERRLDVARWELLPELVGNAGYRGRDEFQGAESQSLIPPFDRVEGFRTSQERDIRFADLNLSWNILDFGLSYVRAQQEADRVLISEEQKRTVVNQILQDVRTAYWRAVSAQRLIGELESLLTQVSSALESSRIVGQRRLSAPLQALRYQRELIGIKRELQSLQRDLGVAKIQLAALMNLAPNQQYTLQMPSQVAPRNLAWSAEQMEALALKNRPEMREIDYRKRINAKETKVALLQLLPGIELNAGANYDSNTFLFKNNWISWGAQVTWNLVNAIKIPARLEQVRVQGQVLDAQSLAFSMAIITQVHVSLAQIAHARNEYGTATDYTQTQQGILQQVQASTGAKRVGQQELIREQMNTLVAKVREDVAYADLENAYASAYAAVGVDPLPTEVQSYSVKDLANALNEHWKSL